MRNWIRRLFKVQVCQSCEWRGYTGRQRGALALAILMVVLFAWMRLPLRSSDAAYLAYLPMVAMLALLGLTVLVLQLQRCPNCGRCTLTIETPHGDAQVRVATQQALLDVVKRDRLASSDLRAPSTPPPREQDLFAPAPTELGPITMAFSSLPKGASMRTPLSVLGIALVFGLLTSALGIVAGLWIGEHLATALLAPLLGGVGIAAGVALFGPDHACYYVGRDGYVRYRYTVWGLREVDRLIFEDARAVYVGYLERHRDKDRWSRRLSYEWYGEGNQLLLSMIVRDYEAIPIKRGEAILQAWNRHMMQRLLDDMGQLGASFELGGSTLSLRRGRESLLQGISGKRHEVTPLDAYSDSNEALRLTFRTARGDQRHVLLTAREVANLDCLLAILEGELGIAVRYANASQLPSRPAPSPRRAPLSQ